MKIRRFFGPKTGNKSAIFFGVHGNEPVGREAVERVIATLEKEKILSGVVSFIPGNLRAMHHNKKQIDENLNRMFTNEHLFGNSSVLSYEEIRARELAPELMLHDALFDVHSTDEDTDPFALTDRKGNFVISHLPASVKSVLYGIDQFHSGSTDWFMHSMNKIGICLECGQHKDEKAVSVGEDAILSFLACMGHIDRRIESSPRVHCEAVNIYTTKTDKFTLTKTYPEFTPLKKGEHIGTDGEEKIFAPRTYDSLIVFSNPCEKAGEEAFVLAREI